LQTCENGQFKNGQHLTDLFFYGIATFNKRMQILQTLNAPLVSRHISLPAEKLDWTH